MAPEPSYGLLPDFILRGIDSEGMLETTEGIVILRVATINASLVPADCLIHDREHDIKLEFDAWQGSGSGLRWRAAKVQGGSNVAQ